MNRIYLEISKLSEKFRTMAYGITQDEERINDAVQELMLYFLQMNPDTLKAIYEKDGVNGITRYGAVALRRSLTSKRSNFYYKYEKYYTHIDSFRYNTSKTCINSNNNDANCTIANLENISYESEKGTYEKLEKIDSKLDTINWYDAEVFKLYYYEGNTLDSLAEKTKISRNSLFTTIDKVREILKKELNEDV